MAAILFRIVVGPIFILAGRYVYRNPRKLYPNAFYTNPESPVLIGLTLLFAFLLMFGGSFAVLTIATEQFAKGIIGAFVALGCSVLIASYLRPRGLPQISQVRAEPQRAVGFLTAKGKWFFGISLAVATVLTIAVVVCVLLRR